MQVRSVQDACRFSQLLQSHAAVTQRKSHLPHLKTSFSKSDGNRGEFGRCLGCSRQLRPQDVPKNTNNKSIIPFLYIRTATHRQLLPHQRNEQRAEHLQSGRCRRSCPSPPSP